MPDPMLRYHRQFASFLDELFDSVVERRPMRPLAEVFETAALSDACADSRRDRDTERKMEGSTMNFATLSAHIAHADRTSLIPLDPKPIRFDWYPGSSIGPVYRKGKQIGHALKDENGHVTLKLEYRGEKLERDKLPWRGLVQMVEAWADGVDAAQAYGERPRYALVSEGGASI